jgi:hypothetical protein
VANRTTGVFEKERGSLNGHQKRHQQQTRLWSIGVIDYWDIRSGVLFVIIGSFNVWLSPSPHFEVNPVTVLLSRWLGGVGRARVLILVLGVFCVLLGVVGIIFAVTGAQ